LDDDYAKNTLFGERIAHGILIANQILKALGYIFRGFS
jgi:acyl dehydratase